MVVVLAWQLFQLGYFSDLDVILAWPLFWIGHGSGLALALDGSKHGDSGLVALAPVAAPACNQLGRLRLVTQA